MAKEIISFEPGYDSNGNMVEISVVSKVSKDLLKSIDLFNLKNYADKYHSKAQTSLIRNNHMNEIKPNEQIEQRIIDAVLVDFINYICSINGIDFALYTSDLTTGNS